MEERIIDQQITLIPYFPNEETTLAWYQNPDVCKQVDNIDDLYTPERLKRMYDYLSSHGQCYYIRYCGTLVGDVTLLDNAEVCIVICKEYQNLHIGRRCIANMLQLAKEKGTQLKPQTLVYRHKFDGSFHPFSQLLNMTVVNPGNPLRRRMIFKL